jgi:hypothetical protein
VVQSESRSPLISTHTQPPISISSSSPSTHLTSSLHPTIPLLHLLSFPQAVTQHDAPYNKFTLASTASHSPSLLPVSCLISPSSPSSPDWTTAHFNPLRLYIDAERGRRRKSTGIIQYNPIHPYGAEDHCLDNNLATLVK